MDKLKVIHPPRLSFELIEENESLLILSVTDKDYRRTFTALNVDEATNNQGGCE